MYDYFVYIKFGVIGKKDLYIIMVFVKNLKILV